MNHLVIPTLLLTSIFFALGVWMERRNAVDSVAAIRYWLALIVALPGVLFAAYYLRALGETVWFYQFRSLPYTELTASGAGLLAGFLFERIKQHARLRHFVGPWFIAFILVLGIAAPYAKPVLWPARWTQFRDQWADDVCLQTSESSCGPACAATLLRLLGKPSTEEQLAHESFTSRTGTENWYLARTLRRHGAKVTFILHTDISQPWPVPSIAGVQLSSFGKSGHFIAVLGRRGDDYVIGDPLFGREVMSQTELAKAHKFTGLFMKVE